MVEAKLCRAVALQDRRWPPLAYTNFTTQHPDYMCGVTNAWQLFIKELVKALVMPHMNRCLEGRPHLQNHITEAMGRCRIKNKTQSPPSQRNTSDRRVNQRGRGAGSAQLPKTDKFIVRPVCKEHKPVVVICEACKLGVGRSILISIVSIPTLVLVSDRY